MILQSTNILKYVEYSNNNQDIIVNIKLMKQNNLTTKEIIKEFSKLFIPNVDLIFSEDFKECGWLNKNDKSICFNLKEIKKRNKSHLQIIACIIHEQKHLLLVKSRNKIKKFISAFPDDVKYTLELCRPYFKYIPTYLVFEEIIVWELTRKELGLDMKKFETEIKPNFLQFQKMNINSKIDYFLKKELEI